MADPVEWMRPSSGRITGWAGIGVAAGMVALAAFGSGGSRLELGLAGAFLGILVWAALLRPAVAVSPSTLVLRNMVETVHLPMAAVDSLAVRQVLAIRVGERRYVSPAIGKSRRQALRGDLGRIPDDKASMGRGRHDRAYTDHVQERILQLADDARARDGIGRGSPEQQALAAQVRREPAWPEIAGLVVTGLALLGALLR